MDNITWAERDLSVLWHPCTQMKDHERLPLIPIKSGQGAWLEDYSGNRYFDAISSWWVNLFGHANPKINAAIKDQLDSLEHVMFAGFSHAPGIELGERLVEITPPGLSKCFYADNGSSAIEVALKMSFHYWRNQGKTKKTKFISLTNSYHGDTLGALAVGDVSLFKTTYKPLLMETIQVKSPDCYYREENETWKEYTERQFDHMLEALDMHADEVAAVIIEPLIQGAGNMRMYDAVYLSLLRKACDDYGVHFIADEVAVGFGRTGKMFACEHANISPDFLCVSKGITGGYLPLSAVMTTDTIYQGFYDDYENLTGFLHSHSYTGNPLACRAALATLDVFKEEPILDHIQALSKTLKELSTLFEDHPNVGDIRQHGLVLAIEMVKDRHSKESYPWQERRGLIAFEHALQNQVLLRPIGNVIYVMPPYITTPEDLDWLVKVAYEGLNKAVSVR